MLEEERYSEGWPGFGRCAGLPAGLIKKGSDESTKKQREMRS